MDALNNYGPVGIENIRVWPCTMALDMRDLVAARGANSKEIIGDMMIDSRSVNPAWEDVVTLGVNAALPIVENERESIKLLLVASESAPDQEKPLSTWIQRHLRLPDDCRNIEVKHACYGGTAALNLASHWLLTQPPGVKALVVTTDLSRQHFHRPHEFVMGGGATAMLVSRDPRFMALDLGLSGVYTHEVADLIRPTSRVEAGHSQTSLLSYLDGVEITLSRYLDALRDRGVEISGLDALQHWAPYQVYHAPFGGITLRAHRAALRSLDVASRQLMYDDFIRRVAPTLIHNSRMGGTYASSVFISLLGLCDSFAREGLEGKRAAIYSYGSGSCAEYYSGVFGAGAQAVTATADLGALLDARRQVDVRGYEEAERERTCWLDDGDYRVSLDGHDGWYDERYRSNQLLTFLGCKDHVRHYAWS